MKNKYLNLTKLLKINFNIDKRGVLHGKRKEMFNRLVKGRGHEFADAKDKIDPNKLVYSFKTCVNRTKDFINYQMLWKLFEDSRDGDTNPKEVLKIKQGLSQT